MQSTESLTDDQCPVEVKLLEQKLQQQQQQSSADVDVEVQVHCWLEGLCFEDSFFLFFFYLIIFFFEKKLSSSSVRVGLCVCVLSRCRVAARTLKQQQQLLPLPLLPQHVTERFARQLVLQQQQQQRYL